MWKLSSGSMSRGPCTKSSKQSVSRAMFLLYYVSKTNEHWRAIVFNSGMHNSLWYLLFVGKEEHGQIRNRFCSGLIRNFLDPWSDGLKIKALHHILSD